MAVTEFSINDAFTMDNFNSRITETNNSFYTKEQTIADTTKTLYGLPNTAVPDDAFKKLSNSLLIEFGSYIGNGLSTDMNNPLSLSFSKEPFLICVYGYNSISTSNFYITPDVGAGIERGISDPNYIATSNKIYCKHLTTNYSNFNGLTRLSVTNMQYPTQIQTCYTKISNDMKTVYWYNYNATAAFNTNGDTYYYYVLYEV